MQSVEILLVKTSIFVITIVFTSNSLTMEPLLTIMLVISNCNYSRLDFKNMKVNQSASLTPHLLAESKRIGQLVARLRLARKVKQTDAALRAGLSRNTVYRLEQGDAGLAIGQILRYLEAIAPGSTLADLLSESDPALVSLKVREQSKRVRGLTSTELEELNF
jgi:transcriptional regulator with XRE-family HTH domain